MSQKTLQKKVYMQRHIVFIVEMAPLECKFCATSRTSINSSNCVTHVHYILLAVYLQEKILTQNEKMFKKNKEMLHPIDADTWFGRGLFVQNSVLSYCTP